MKDIVFSTTTEPIKLNIDFKRFLNYLLKYNEGETKYIEQLISALEPTIKLWSNLISNHLYYEDFTIYSICKFLNSDDKPVGIIEDKIKNYLKYNEINDVTVESDITLLFCEFFAKKTIFKNSTYDKPIKLYFHIAMEMKYLIFIHIRKINQLCKRDLYFHKESLYFDYQNEYHEDPHDIVYLLNQIDSISPWYSYLFKLIKEGYSLRERCKLLHLTPKELHKEENLIWQLLKQKQLDSSIQLDLM